MSIACKGTSGGAWKWGAPKEAEWGAPKEEPQEPPTLKAQAEQGV